jgi:hypothetical protein
LAPVGTGFSRRVPRSGISVKKGRLGARADGRRLQLVEPEKIVFETARFRQVFKL